MVPSCDPMPSAWAPGARTSVRSELAQIRNAHLIERCTTEFPQTHAANSRSTLRWRLNFDNHTLIASQYQTGSKLAAKNSLKAAFTPSEVR